MTFYYLVFVEFNPRKTKTNERLELRLFAAVFSFPAFYIKSIINFSCSLLTVDC